jgi:serine protease Do
MKFLGTPRRRKTRLVADAHAAIVLVVGIVASGLTGVVVAAEPIGLAEERAFRAAAARVAAAVVRIESSGVSAAAVDGPAEAAPTSGPSTGLVVDSRGWIITTAFAVPEDVEQAIVVLPDPATGAVSRMAGRVVGRDVSRGVVLVKVEPPAALAAVGSGVPRESLSVGQWTIAVARGWDVATPNVAVGVLSAVNRAWGRAVQTDAAVSPANYGGALIDIRGDVIGMLAPLPADTAGMMLGTELYDSGIGFAVPLEDIRRVLPRLEAGETLVPGVLGISYRSRDVFTGVPTIATSRPGSPAAVAGVQPGDTIVSIAGQPVSRIAEVRHALSPLYAGDDVELVVERQEPEAGKAAQRITLRPRLVATLPPWRRGVIGIVPRRVAMKNNDDRDEAGPPVVVDWVWPGSPAAAAGIVAGMTVRVITPPGEAAEPVAVTSAAALAGVLGGVEVGDRVTLSVKDAAGKEQSRLLATVAMPTDIPAQTPTRPETADAAEVVKLEAAEVAAPPIAVIPAGTRDDPVGVLVYFGRPRGAVAVDEAAAWRNAANRYGVAVILPGSIDPQRWSRDDIRGVARSIDSLRGRRAIDPSRLAMAGSGAGGAFAWLAAEALGPAFRGIALLDAALPRQAKVDPAEPGRFRWVLFDPPRTEGKLPLRIEADRDRLMQAGYDVGVLPERDVDTLPVETLCSFVEALGLL